jgi:hypothetical protein
MGEMVEPAIAPIPLAGAIEEGQVLRQTLFKEAPLERCGEHLGMPRPDEPAHGDGRSTRDRRDRFIGGGKMGWGTHERKLDR